VDWAERAGAAVARYRDGESRLDRANDEDPRQRQLTRLGNTAWAAGLSLLMAGRRDEANEWLRRAAERYRESWQDAPPGSWGRPIGAMKALLLAGEDPSEAAQWALDAGAAEAESPIGRYAGTLALLVLGRDVDARVLASTLRERDDFPRDVADALTTVAAADRIGYLVAVEDVLESFETRTEFLEDIAVADTVLVLQLLAAQRDAAVDLPPSPRLPT
jgi:tetratricopeptide (TPR) repeat protein